MKSQLTNEVLSSFDNYREAIRNYVNLAVFFGAKFNVSSESKRLSFQVEELTISLKKINY